MLETIHQCLRPWRGKNLLKRLVQEISENHIAVVVETTGHKTSIRQHTYLLDQSLAEELRFFLFPQALAIRRRPRELSVKLQIEVVAKSESVGPFPPGFRHILLYEPHHLLVLLVPSPLVPEPEHDASAALRRQGREAHHLVNIGGELSPLIALMGMEGQLDFMWQRVEQIHGTTQQCTVGGEHGLEPLLPCRPDELWQKRMEQRLTHQMEIEETHLPPDPVREQVEFLRRQLPPVPVMLGAEVAVEVANVRDFYVTAIYHHIPIPVYWRQN